MCLRIQKHVKQPYIYSTHEARNANLVKLVCVTSQMYKDKLITSNTYVSKHMASRKSTI